MGSRNWFGRALADKIAALEKRLNAALRTLAAREKKWDEADEAIAQFHTARKAYEQECAQMREVRKELEKTLEEAKRELEKLRKEWQQMPPVPPTFDLPEDEAVLFPNERAKLRSAMKTTLDLADVYAAITGEKAEMLRAMVEAYEADLKKAYAKLGDDEDMDDDDRSERYTEKFLGVLSNRLLQTLMVSIRLGLKEQPEVYKPLLVALNAYLARCHVGTDRVQPGDKIADLSGTVKAMPHATEDAVLWGTIEEVEHLPYHLHYLNDRGDIDVQRVPGAVVLWARR